MKLNDLLTEAINHIPEYSFSKDRDHSPKIAEKLQQICVQFKQDLGESPLQKDQFMDWFSTYYPRVTKSDTDLGEIILASKEYSIIINASVAVRENEQYQNSATIMVVGFAPNITKYDTEETSQMIANIARMQGCQFGTNEEYSQLRSNKAINSGIINIESGNSSMNAVYDMISKVKTASRSAKEYLEEKQ